jgi:P27 family predicted phage terminase small subunit
VARPGPRPLPSPLRRAAGQRPDRLNPAEPLPALDPDPPEPPDWLCPEAQVIWHGLAPEMHRAGILTSLDVITFASYCDLAVQVQKAREILARGLLLKGRRDPYVTNPAWRMYRDGQVLLRAYAIELGLTPSARSQIRALPPAPQEQSTLPAPGEADEVSDPD